MLRLRRRLARSAPRRSPRRSERCLNIQSSSYSSSDVIPHREAAAKKKLQDEAAALAKAHAEAAAKEKAAAEKRKAEEEKVCGTESDAMVAPVSPVHCPAGAQKGGGRS